MLWGNIYIKYKNYLILSEIHECLHACIWGHLNKLKLKYHYTITHKLKTGKKILFGLLLQQIIPFKSTWMLDIWFSFSVEVPVAKPVSCVAYKVTKDKLLRKDSVHLSGKTEGWRYKSALSETMWIIFCMDSCLSDLILWQANSGYFNGIY